MQRRILVMEGICSRDRCQYIFPSWNIHFNNQLILTIDHGCFFDEISEDYRQLLELQLQKTSHINLCRVFSIYKCYTYVYVGPFFVFNHVLNKSSIFTVYQGISIELNMYTDTFSWSSRIQMCMLICRKGKHVHQSYMWSRHRYWSRVIHLPQWVITGF